MQTPSFYSIKTQIVAAFFLMVLPLASLIYFSSLTNRLFNDVLDELIETEGVSYLLSEVEKDIVDLQRNILIFKETSSPGAIEKVNFYYIQIVNRLVRLKSYPSVIQYLESINVMAQHLDDYKQNFDVVTGMRIQRSELITRHLQAKPVAEIPMINATDIELMAIENSVLLAHGASLSYLASFDHNHITEFDRRVEEARILLAGITGSDSERVAVNQNLQVYQKNFSRIVALTRHYVYLINVVMTGSANEFLYHGKTLEDIFSQRADNTRLTAKERMSSNNVWSSILSMAGILLAIIVFVLFYLRITRPVEAITSVFIQLAEGKDVGSIPAVNRRDEIGLLSSAANVFKSKNEQTIKLLVESKKMVRDQKVLNEELEIEKRRAERALSIKTEFLANMSHELRTPLNSIIGFTVRLGKQLDTKNERQLKAVDAIERNGRHLLAMINDILDLSKIEANKLELKITNVDLSALCMDCTSQINPAAEEKGIELVFNPASIPEVQSDPVRIRQILFNLLSNAVKYTNEGFVKVEIESGYGDMSVAIRVSDTGLGIKPEDQKKLFKRFEQFDDNTRFAVGQGSGLGLAIVANVSRLLGANVSVSSEFGKGSTFTLRIPVNFRAAKSTSNPLA
ncbi:sensor histidine kinase [Teredinibacter purpureus]|uniref:sensor histidine kinase n=1 Tax=Teredinibacter purpureus TaxID=2731756 RepID=UPI0005F7C149|nr:ATP-binding protein [Teredinibacter purpureus]